MDVRKLIRAPCVCKCSNMIELKHSGLPGATTLATKCQRAPPLDEKWLMKLVDFTVHSRFTFLWSSVQDLRSAVEHGMQDPRPPGPPPTRQKAKSSKMKTGTRSLFYFHPYRSFTTPSSGFSFSTFSLPHRCRAFICVRGPLILICIR